MAEEKNVHDGHRKRMKEKLLEHGLSIFNDHEILEILLYYVIPKQDTNPLAHELINTFGGTLNGVFDAPMNELLRVKGIGENAATLIKLIPMLSRKYYEASAEDKQRIYDIDSAANALMSKFIGEKEEILVVLLIGSDGRQLSCKTISRGSIHEVPVYIRTLTSYVLSYNTDTVVIAHNHPSGNIMFSSGDMLVTKEIYKALSGVGINLYDHIVFAQKEYNSMRKSGLMDLIYDEMKDKNRDYITENIKGKNAAGK